MNYDGIMPPFRDEEAELFELIDKYLEAKWPDPVYSGDETPDAGLDGKMPYVRLGRVGGATRPGAEHTDRPVVDVDVYASTRRDAKRIAQLIEQFLISCPHPIDSCTVLMAPQRVTWVEGVPVRRFYASYHLGLRR